MRKRCPSSDTYAIIEEGEMKGGEVMALGADVYIVRDADLAWSPQYTENNHTATTSVSTSTLEYREQKNSTWGPCRKPNPSPMNANSEKKKKKKSQFSMGIRFPSPRFLPAMAVERDMLVLYSF